LRWFFGSGRKVTENLLVTHPTELTTTVRGEASSNQEKITSFEWPGIGFACVTVADEAGRGSSKDSCGESWSWSCCCWNNKLSMVDSQAINVSVINQHRGKEGKSLRFIRSRANLLRHMTLTLMKMSHCFGVRSAINCSRSVHVGGERKRSRH
jgi:hypothetical protein